MTITKKGLIILALILCLTFCFAFTACDNNDSDDVLFSVTFVYGNGQANSTAYVKENGVAFEPESPAREGYEFIGWKKQGEQNLYDFSTPITQDITLEAQWEVKISTVTITWEDDDEAYSFLFDSTTPRKVTKGTRVEFGIRISPYYVGTPVVSVDGTVLKPDDEGLYSFIAEKNVNVGVSGLKSDNAIIKGLGTSSSPYLISNAAQLRTLAESVNGGEDTYIDAYIALTKDIDLDGEKIEPIGTATRCFQGEFDGKGHSVANFGLKSDDTVLGFFGYVATGTVKNLTVKSDIIVETSQKISYIVGGICGYNIGADITNCTYEGSISLNSNLSASSNYVTYLGGICGFMQGYAPNYIGDISYCTVRGTVASIGQTELYAAGGIVGAIHGVSQAASAVVYNCVFDGNVTGKNQMAGGIVGYLRDIASVANCYVDGAINANSQTMATYAGSIAGASDNETSITHCVATATLTHKTAGKEEHIIDSISGRIFKEAFNSVDSRQAVLQNNYYAKDDILELNNKTYSLKLLSDAKTLADWFDGDWKEEDGDIVPVYNETERNIKAHFVFGTEVTREDPNGNPLTLTQDDVTLGFYGSIYWIYGGSGMNNFTADNGLISYGYFFDAEHTQRVPSSYIVTNETTIYVGFADYNAVQGDYYAVMQVKKDSSTTVEAEVRLVFDNNGKMTMYYDGAIANYMYVYDGNNLLIRNGYFAQIQYGSLTNLSLLTDYYAEFSADGKRLEIYDTVWYKKGNDSIIAYKENAAMGVWHSNDGVDYTFKANNTGTITDASGTQSFVYSCTDSTVSITIGKEYRSLRILEDGLTMDGYVYLHKYDQFEGVWESDFNTTGPLWFDGNGTVRFNGTNYSYTVRGSGDDAVVEFFTDDTVAYRGVMQDGLLVITSVGSGDKVQTIYKGTWENAFKNEGIISFDGKGKVIYSGATYDYTIVDDKATFGSYSAHFNEDGLLVLQNGDQKKIFGKNGSFIGTWIETRLNYMFQLNGISKDGYGTGVDSNGVRFNYSVDVYEDVLMVNIYYGMSMYGMFNIATGYDGSQMLYAAIYTPSAGYMLDEYQMTYYDAFYGTWNGTDGKTYTFNGLGEYDIDHTGSDGVRWLAKGQVVVEDNGQTEVRYYYDRTTRTARFTIGEVEYVVSLESDGIKINTTVCKQPDDVSAYKYHIGDIVVEFNGKAPVGLGKATVTDGTDVQYYDYTESVSGSEYIVVLTKDGVEAYRFVFKDGDFTVTKDGNAVSDVGIYHALVGKTYVIAEGRTFSITKAMGTDGITTAQFAGEEVDVMYVDANFVALYYNEEFLYYVGYQDENNAALFDASKNVVAILTVSDGMEGVYESKDGTKIEFDGRSNGSKYTYAYVTITTYVDVDGNVEEDIERYAYKKEDGVFYIYEINRSGEQDVLIKKYRIDFEEVDGAIAFTDSEGTTVYLTKLEEDK